MGTDQESGGQCQVEHQHHCSDGQRRLALVLAERRPQTGGQHGAGHGEPDQHHRPLQLPDARGAQNLTDRTSQSTDTHCYHDHTEANLHLTHRKRHIRL